MAPKKEKGGAASTNSKAWEPSLIAAHFNQVSRGAQVPPVPAAPTQSAPPAPRQAPGLPDATLPL